LIQEVCGQLNPQNKVFVHIGQLLTQTQLFPSAD